MTTEEVSFIESIQEIVGEILSGVSTVFPATIISPSSIEGLVDVQPSHKYKTPGDAQEHTPRAINNVPLIYPNRTKGTITRPPKEYLIGSKVLCLTCEHSITEWRSSRGKAVFPKEPRQFDKNDCVAIGGLYSELEKWPNPQLPNTFEILGIEGTKFAIGTKTADLLNIMYQFLNFFQTVVASDGDTLASNLTTAQADILLNLKTAMAKITNI